MNDLQLPPNSFDLIWAEGSAYIMGVENALKTWKRFLKPRGYIGLSELLWITNDPPIEAKRFFQDEYPAMSDVETNLAMFAQCGYSLVCHFTLPDHAWWTNYYAPLQAKLPQLQEKYRSDEQAMSYIDLTQTEIEMRQKFGTMYGYEFFVAQVRG